MEIHQGTVIIFSSHPLRAGSMDAGSEIIGGSRQPENRLWLSFPSGEGAEGGLFLLAFQNGDHIYRGLRIVRAGFH